MVAHVSPWSGTSAASDPCSEEGAGPGLRLQAGPKIHWLLQRPWPYTVLFDCLHDAPVGDVCSNARRTAET